MKMPNVTSGEWSELRVETCGDLGVLLQFDSGPEYLIEPDTWAQILQYLATADERYLNPRNTRPSIN